jgi:hypothetical protein
MYGKAVTLFKVFGFSVRVDASWLVILALPNCNNVAGANDLISK